MEIMDTFNGKTATEILKEATVEEALAGNCEIWSSDRLIIAYAGYDCIVLRDSHCIVLRDSQSIKALVRMDEEAKVLWDALITKRNGLDDARMERNRT